MSIDIWRARIGGFASIMMMIFSTRKNTSKRDNGDRPRKDRQTRHKGLLDELTTHNATAGVLFCLIFYFSINLISCQRNPMALIIPPYTNLVLLALHGAIVMYTGVYLSNGKIRTSRQYKMTIALRLVLFMILLLCCDVESNPGPGPADSVS